MFVLNLHFRPDYVVDEIDDSNMPETDEIGNNCNAGHVSLPVSTPIENDVGKAKGKLDMNAKSTRDDTRAKSAVPNSTENRIIGEDVTKHLPVL